MAADDEDEVSVFMRMSRDLAHTQIDDLLDGKIRQLHFFAKLANKLTMLQSSVLKLHLLGLHKLSIHIRHPVIVLPGRQGKFDFKPTQAKPSEMKP